MYALASLGLCRSAGAFCVAGAALGALQGVGCHSHSLTHSTHSLTHSLTLTHSLPLTHYSLTHPLTHSTHSLTLTHLLTHALPPSPLPRSLARSLTKGAKILKPKFQTRARRKQHRTRGPTVLLATHARQRRYRPAGLAGCRCTQSWFAGSSGRLRPRKHESIQNTSCLDIASLFIRQGFGTGNSLFHRRQTLCYQRTVQLW